PLIPFALLGELPGESWLNHPSSVYVFFMGIALLSSDIFLPIPSSLISVFLGARLGLWGGALAILLGLNLGIALGYYAGWYFGYPLVRRYASETQREIINHLENRFSYLALAMLRVVPVLAEASVLGAGAARFKPRPVFLTLLISNLSLALLYASIGSVSQGISSPALLFLGGIGIPTASVLIVYAVHRWLYVST
ncbi:MAG: VTT domain-containing protein, partial [Nitrospira sp.]|nr:VTT domain-containing protein [Nitrospira sp.]